MGLASRIRSAAANRTVVNIAGQGVSALAIKVSSAGLSFLMFVVLARVTSKPEFGRFGFGFSLATFLALAAGLGQSILVLRFVPIYRSDGNDRALRGLVLFGYRAVFSASLVLGFGLVLVSVIRGSLNSVTVFTALLALGMAVAEYQSGLFRSMGKVTAALLPRDVLWRALVICVCIPAVMGWKHFYPHKGASAATFLGIVSCLLLALLIIQFLAFPTVSRAVFGSRETQYEGARWTRSSLGLWLNAVLQTGAQQLGVVLAGFVISAADTGGLFAAVKAAVLLNFFLLAGNIVSAPYISRLFHTGQMMQLRRLSAWVTLVAAVPTVLVFVFYCVYGRGILSFFGQGFSTYYSSLVILAGSQVINALSGQTGILMGMTGHERKLNEFVLISNVVPLAAVPVFTPALGPWFAALCIACGTSLWNIQAALWARRHIGVDTSIVGAVQTVFARPRSQA